MGNNYRVVGYRTNNGETYCKETLVSGLKTREEVMTVIVTAIRAGWFCINVITDE